MTVRVDPEEHEPTALDRIGIDFTGRRVLEVGCGDGRLTRRYMDRALSIVALDPDPIATTAFGVGERWPAHVEFTPLPFADYRPETPRFDLVVFSWSL
jgi:hypothetical protein